MDIVFYSLLLRRLWVQIQQHCNHESLQYDGAGAKSYWCSLTSLASQGQIFTFRHAYRLIVKRVVITLYYPLPLPSTMRDDMACTFICDVKDVRKGSRIMASLD
jgi:hypothetical protein